MFNCVLNCLKKKNKKGLSNLILDCNCICDCHSIIH